MSGSVACGPKDTASSMSVNNGIQLMNFKNLLRKISHWPQTKYYVKTEDAKSYKNSLKRGGKLERFEFIS